MTQSSKKLVLGPLAGRVRVLSPHLRGIGVLGIFVALLLSNCPTPERFGTPQFLKTSAGKEHVATWAARLGRSQESVASVMKGASSSYQRWHSMVVRPLMKLSDFTGTRQGWTMFANPRRQGGRLLVFVEDDHELPGPDELPASENSRWRLVHSAKRGAVKWRGLFWKHHRIRKLLGQIASDPQRPEFGELSVWISKEIANDFPLASRVKIEFVVWPLLSPEQVERQEERREGLARRQIFELEPLR